MLARLWNRLENGGICWRKSPVNGNSNAGLGERLFSSTHHEVNCGNGVGMEGQSWATYHTQLSICPFPTCAICYALVLPPHYSPRGEQPSGWLTVRSTELAYLWLQCMIERVCVLVCANEIWQLIFVEIPQFSSTGCQSVWVSSSHSNRLPIEKLFNSCKMHRKWPWSEMHRVSLQIVAVRCGNHH